MSTRKLLLQVIAFLCVTGLFAVALVFTVGRVRFEDTTTYRAVFADVTGLIAGDDVRAAGVNVGKVKDVQLRGDDSILVTFTAQNDVPVSTGSHAIVRYKNLVGDRFLAITQGPAGSAPRLAANGELPIAQTAPALDLDALYNGFAPLFHGLAPQEINTLSASLIQVLQGEGGNVEDILANVGSLTSTLADRDQVIGALIDNLNSVVSNLNQHGPQLGNLIDRLQQLVSGLAQQRDPLVNSFNHISALSQSVGGLLERARPDLKGDVVQLDRLAALLNSDRDLLNKQLGQLPQAYQKISRLGAAGSQFNFYLCGLELKLTGLNGPITVPVAYSGVQRCQ